ncbi:MAG TPA: hypothetical protein VJY54_06590 [Lachnospiraceae bacterium]|nr:hypothetical protein [Lachnospiraceae bacterium]
MTKDSNKSKIYNYICEAVMFLLTCFCVCFFSILKGSETIVVIRNTVMCGMEAIIMIYLMELAHDTDTYDFDNAKHVLRFPILYLICLLLSTAFSFLPSSGWSFLVIFVLLSLFSNTLIGIYCSTLLLTVAVFISGAGVEIFLLYFICGVAASCLFRELDDTYKIGVPVILSILLLMTAETANVVLFANETLHFNLFLIPLLNVIISIVLLLITLKIFSSVVIYRYRDKYMEINDPECNLLVQLKEKSKDEYYHAVHTAYFCDRIAHKLSLDAGALKAGGYYHKIGILSGENTWEQVKSITQNYNFPAAVNEILKEYLSKGAPVKKKETAVLILSDAIVASMSFLFSRNKSEILDYDQIIETVFKKKLENVIFQECDIRMEEISKMKKIFKEEKLYYDFLR